MVIWLKEECAFRVVRASSPSAIWGEGMNNDQTCLAMKIGSVEDV